MGVLHPLVSLFTLCSEAPLPKDIKTDRFLERFSEAIGFFLEGGLELVQ
jgi:hypothetical protein